MTFLTVANRTNPASVAVDAIVAPAATALSGFAGTVALWLKVRAERQALGQLSYSRLEDLGIDPSLANREASRPFWDVRTRG